MYTGSRDSDPVDEDQLPVATRFMWEAKEVAGIYMARLETEYGVSTRNLTKRKVGVRLILEA